MGADRISAALELDLAVHLGLLALSASLLAWSLLGLQTLILEVVKILRIAKSGHLVLGWSARVQWASVELLFRILSIGAGMTIVGKSYRFFTVAEELVGLKGSGIDWGLFERIWGRCEALTHEMLWWSGFIAATSGVCFLLQFVGRFRFSEILAPPSEVLLPHSHILPGEWRRFPLGLWESRLESAVAALPPGNSARVELVDSLHGGLWRRSWPAWAKLVSEYQRECERSGVPGETRGDALKVLGGSKPIGT